MSEAHDVWITAFVLEHEHKVMGRCREAVVLMKQAFPELLVSRGHVSTIWGMRAHWWLLTPEGEVVDPTASQYPGIFEYLPWEPGDEVQVGKCMNCGEEIWEPTDSLDGPPPQKSICSPKCNDEMMEYLDGERSKSKGASSLR